MAQVNTPGVAPVQIPSGGFGVDGDALANYPTPGMFSTAGDWFSDPAYPGTGGTIFNMSTPDPFDFVPALVSPIIMAKHYNDPYDGIDPTRFPTSNKINDDPNTYAWGPGGTNNPAKNEINNATVAFTFGDPNLGGDPNDLWAIIAGDRATVNGSSYIDFEFLQNSLTMVTTGIDQNTGLAKGGFVSTGPHGGRTLGDALITLEFINGGVIAQVVVNIWSLVNGKYQYVTQDINNYTGEVFSTANLVVTTAPWLPFGQPQYLVNQYAEAAVNLSAIFGFSANDCGYISTVFVRTRTSGNSSSSELTDLPGEPFQVNITTEDLAVTCPDPVILTACTSSADITSAYNAWAAGFTVTGTHNPQSNLAQLPALPADANCNGADLTFSLSATDDCGTLASCASTFFVAADVPVDATCAAPVNITDPCTPLADIQTAYNSWVAGFSYTGGCNPATNIGSIPALPANVDCAGANLTFTYSVTSDCSTDWCVSTFDVAGDVAVEATCAAPVNITDACTSLADIQSAYDSWVAGFSYTGGCNPATNIGSIPALPANVDCAGANLTFTYSVTSDCSTDWCVSTFDVAGDVAVEATCAAPANITDACTPLADIQSAYDSWVEGFSYTGGCNPATNIGSIPALPANVDCAGANLTFTYSVTSDCSTDWCVSTFVVAPDDEGPTLVTNLEDLTFTCDQTVVIPTVEFTDNCGTVETVCEITGWSGDCADYVFLPGTTTEVCFSAIDDCGNASDVACITITVEDCASQFCTVTQGFYGNSGGLYCDGRTTTELLNDLLTSPLTVGANNRTFTIPAGASQCVIDILPAGGPSQVLPIGSWGCGNLGGLVDKKGELKNSLLAQTITLGLNMRLDSDLGGLEFTSPNFYVRKSSACGQDDAYPVGDPIYYTGSNGMPASIMNLFGGTPTVMEIYTLANQALGGITVNVPLGDITLALGKINNALDKCAFIYFIPVLQSSPITPEAAKDAMTLKVAPNPFSHEATISYQVKMDSKVTLEVYNMQGAKIATLFEGQADAGVDYSYKYISSDNTQQFLVVVLRSNYGTISERVIRLK